MKLWICLVLGNTPVGAMIAHLLCCMIAWLHDFFQLTGWLTSSKRQSHLNCKPANSFLFHTKHLLHFTSLLVCQRVTVFKESFGMSLSSQKILAWILIQIDQRKQAHLQLSLFQWILVKTMFLTFCWTMSHLAESKHEMAMRRLTQSGCFIEMTKLSVKRGCNANQPCKWQCFFVHWLMHQKSCHLLLTQAAHAWI